MLLCTTIVTSYIYFQGKGKEREEKCDKSKMLSEDFTLWQDHSENKTVLLKYIVVQTILLFLQCRTVGVVQ